MDVNVVSDVGQKEIHAAESLVLKPSAFEVEMAIGKVKSHRSPGINQISAEFIKADGRTICFEIHERISWTWDREELPEDWKESAIVPTLRRVIKQTVVIIEAYQFYQLHTKFYPTFCCQG